MKRIKIKVLLIDQDYEDFSVEFDSEFESKVFGQVKDLVWKSLFASFWRETSIVKGGRFVKLLFNLIKDEDILDFFNDLVSGKENI